MSSWTGSISTSDANPWNRSTNMSAEAALVPLPHRPPLATSDTLQVPSNLAGSARAEPDRMTPALSASATTDVLNMGCVPLLNVPVLPGFDLIGLEGGEGDLTHALDAYRLRRCFREVDH